MGIPLVTMPPFTSYGGPWLASDKYTAEYKIYTQLIAQLPKVLFFQQTMHPDRQQWLPLHWAGFRQSVRYTYRLHPETDLDAVWKGFFPSLRTHLRKAERMVQIVRADTAIDTLWSLNGKSWNRQGLQQPHIFQTFCNLHEALESRGHCALWLAVNKSSDIPLAALYLTFDGRSAGVLITGCSEEGRSVGALHALYWEAIRFALPQGMIFDFEGSMHPGIGEAFRAYNGALTPYNRIYRWL
jgi:hypothetical protein